MSDPRPPQPDDVPMQGDRDLFKGANPWSGPYLVLVILGVVVAVFAVFLVAALFGLN